MKNPTIYNAKRILNTKISLFDKPIANVTNSKQVTLYESYQKIKTKHYEQVTKDYQALGDEEDKGKFKCENFDSLIFGGVFSKRHNKGLEKKSNFGVIDLDNIPKKELKKLRKKLSTHELNLKSLVMMFVSPSGKGLKLVYLIDNERYDHAQCIRGLLNFLYSSVGVEKEFIDASGKDLARACFIPYDPKAFLNPKLIEGKEGLQPFDPSRYLKEFRDERIISSVTIDGGEFGTSYDKFIRFEKSLNKNDVNFQSGNRNEFTFRFASLAVMEGIPRVETLGYLDAKYKLSTFDDHLETFNYIYSRKRDELEKLAQERNVQYSRNKIVQTEDESPYETPIVEDSIADKFPRFLVDVRNLQNSERESDVAMFSTLGMLSGSLPNVKCIHRDEDFYPNLILIIRAPFASGKGSAGVIEKIGEKVSEYQLSKSQELMKAYMEELKLYEKGEIFEKPEEPLQHLLFIPADSSAAALKDKLIKCGGIGVIFDTEADTLNDMMGQTHGAKAFSSTLRKVAMNETIHYSRKYGDAVINNPCASAVITGTPRSIINLVPNAEDGLFSRLAIYSYWKNGDLDPNMFGYEGWGKNKDVYSNLADSFFKMFKKLERLDKKGITIYFHWTKNQGKQLFKLFKKWFEGHMFIHDKNSAGIMKRLAITATRIGTVLNVLRVFENGEFNTLVADSNSRRIMLPCNDVDFENTVYLLNILRQHIFSVYENLPSSENSLIDKSNKARMSKFYDLLPKEFKREEALAEIAPKVPIKERTMGKYLTLLVSKNLLLRKPGEQGVYLKVDKN